MSSVPENVPRLFYLVLGSNVEAQAMIVAWRKYQLLSSSTLDTHFRTRIALYVSGINNCAYSRDWFSRFLRHSGESDSAIAVLASGRKPSTHSPLESRLFDFASLLTFQAWKTTEGYIDEIRKNGLDDRSLLQFMMLVSYFNFENRVVFGLGLAPEPLER